MGPSNFHFDKAVKGLMGSAEDKRQNYQEDDANRIAAAIGNGNVVRHFSKMGAGYKGPAKAKKPKGHKKTKSLRVKVK